MSSRLESRSVSWWPVHEYVATLIAQADNIPTDNIPTDNIPTAGTPAWQQLADGDPRKLLAVAVAGEHHVLRMEIAQEARAEASKAIAAEADWPGIAREIRELDQARRSGVRIERSTHV